MVLLEVDLLADLPAAVRPGAWRAELFLHLYGPLNLEAVVRCILSRQT